MSMTFAVRSWDLLDPVPLGTILPRMTRPVAHPPVVPQGSGPSGGAPRRPAPAQSARPGPLLARSAGGAPAGRARAWRAHGGCRPGRRATAQLLQGGLHGLQPQGPLVERRLSSSSVSPARLFRPCVARREHERGGNCCPEDLAGRCAPGGSEVVQSSISPVTQVEALPPTHTVPSASLDTWTRPRRPSTVPWLTT